MKLLPASLCFMLPLLAATPVLAQNAPATWTEHWFEHNQTVSRVYQDNDVAIYFDPDVNRSITWPNSFVRDVWKYTKKTYGHFGSDMQLYAIFHTGKYGGGHPSTYFDADHDYRNVIDVGAAPPRPGRAVPAGTWTSSPTRFPISWSSRARVYRAHPPSTGGATASGRRSSSTTSTGAGSHQ
ncbi:hypothetical protein ACN28S_40870 [Cystobacter fuscus]